MKMTRKFDKLTRDKWQKISSVILSLVVGFRSWSLQCGGQEEDE